MKIESYKEGSKKYLSINDVEFDENSYGIQMILNNNIQGLLPIKINVLNNNKSWLCDITALLTLQSIYERKLMRANDLIKFVSNIKQLMDVLKEYLLESENIILDVNHIYYHKQREEFIFCYSPIKYENIDLQLKELFNKLLDHINHNDRETVEMAYGLQQITTQDEFSTEELLEYCIKKKELHAPKIIEKEHDTEINEINESEEEVEIEKETIWEKIRKHFKKKNNYDSLDDFESEEDYELEKISNVLFEKEEALDEDATMLLTNALFISDIHLRSVNLDEELLIEPSNFPYVIGKSKKSSDYQIARPVVSRVHARLIEEQGVYYIEDLNSTNGTIVNNEKLLPHETRKIEGGDEVTIADVNFVVE